MILREDDERPCPPVIRDVLVGKNGWKLYDESVSAHEQPPFNLFWKTNRLYPSQIESCKYPSQRCNHYPKSAEITKKDGLYRNLRRMRVTHGPSLYSFIPETFTLPNEYVKFCQYFAEERDKAGSSSSRNPFYICKPSDLSRGRKIFVFDDIGELTYDCSSVVQRYIENPLLILGHKVDFRIYVLVSSFQPLRIYMFDDFLTRFGGEKYTMDSKDMYVHLTNYSVTKTTTTDTLLRAGVANSKWDGQKTREYFKSCGVDFSLMWARIETLVRATILSIFHLVPRKPQCFELFGFDILFDDQLQPWLIEANFSPALAVESEVDVRVKHALIHDLVMTLNIHEPVTPPPSEPPQSDVTDSGQPAAGLRKPVVVSDTAMKRSSSTSRLPHTGNQGRQEPSTPTQALPRGRSGVLPPATKTPPLSTRPSATRPTAPSTSSSIATGMRRSNSTATISRVAKSLHSPAQPGAAVDHPQQMPLVDRPYGQMKLIFPFNDETQQFSMQALASNQLESALRGMITEVRRVDARVVPQLKALAAVYAEATKSYRNTVAKKTVT